ncbi:unnamed protein product, partial [marine sediment metagenome]
IVLLKDNGEIMKIFKIRNDYAGYIDFLFPEFSQSSFSLRL